MLEEILKMDSIKEFSVPTKDCFMDEIVKVINSDVSHWLPKQSEFSFVIGKLPVISVSSPH